MHRDIGRQGSNRRGDRVAAGVDLDHRADLVVEMHIGADHARAAERIPDKIADLDLFAGLADDLVVDFRECSAADHRGGQVLHAGIGRARQGIVAELFGRGDKVVAARDEVRLAAQGRHRHGLAVAAAFADEAAFGGFPVGPLGQGGHALFAKRFHRLFKIAGAFFQRFLAIHHSLPAHFAELDDDCGIDFCHTALLLYGVL